ncbi:hypothetical protein EDD17DRAFT_1573271 [Pisolithus thermaeus]|nr:hypothetical protein EV401DRAFT_1910594 [Pisolithus croceorrhizus]KAI6162886.1 hypothetical protein EDD17DRAFT_1573271 [Pisolithus thermaeus]
MSKSTLTWWCWVHGTPLLSIGFIEASLEMNVDTQKGDPVNADLYNIPKTHQLPTEEYENEICVVSIPDLG